MSALDAFLVVLAGIGAGTINTIVGSGTLITFPTLLLLGIPPITANISNNIGLVPGSLTGSIGYRKELVGCGAHAAAARADVVARGGRRRRAAARARPQAVPRHRARAHPARAGARRDRPSDQRLGRATTGGGHGQRGQPRARDAGRGLRGRGLRRLLRCGAGHHPDGHPGRPVERADPAAQRLQERARDHRQRRRRRGLHPRGARPDRLAGRAAHRHRLDHRRGDRLDRRAPAAAAGAARGHRRRSAWWPIVKLLAFP